MSGASTDTEQVIRDYVAWENGDHSKQGAVSESVDVYNAGLPGGEVHSREGRDAYNRKIREAFPDYHVEIQDVAVNGSVGMMEVKITGTHKGEFKDLPPTGREVEILAMSKLQVEHGTVVEVRDYYDTAELQAQLGLTFPEVIGQLPKLLWGKVRSIF